MHYILTKEMPTSLLTMIPDNFRYPFRSFKGTSDSEIVANENNVEKFHRSKQLLFISLEFEYKNLYYRIHCGTFQKLFINTNLGI